MTDKDEALTNPTNNPPATPVPPVTPIPTQNLAANLAFNLGVPVASNLASNPTPSPKPPSINVAPSSLSSLPSVVTSTVVDGSTAQLCKDKQTVTEEECGKFSYKISWILQKKLAFDTIVVQKIKIDYFLKCRTPGLNGKIERIDDISYFTRNVCTWKDYSVYWEMWCIPAGGLSPTYDKNFGLPAFPSKTKPAEPAPYDDEYSNGIIMARDHGTRLMLGWVRYTGTAQLYNVKKLGKGYLKKFKIVPASPAGALPVRKTDPGFDPNAMVGRAEPHHMVAYWNNFGSGGWKRATKVEIDQLSNDAALLAKAEALDPTGSFRPAPASACSRQGQNQVKKNLGASLSVDAPSIKIAGVKRKEAPEPLEYSGAKGSRSE